MRRLLVLSLLLTFIAGALIPAATTAQETGTALGPAIGETSSIYSEDGNEIGSVTVNDVIEPFESYDPGYDPQRGYHYVVLDVTITNSGSRPMAADPSAFQVIDSDGFIADTGFFSSSAPGAPVFLEYQDALGPGEEAAGAVAYEVFNESTISRIIYNADFTSRVNVVDLRAGYTAAGTPVSVIGVSGSEIAQVTVNGIADPFEAYDEFSAPARGSRYVLVDVTISNTGSQLLSTGPDDFTAIDDQGFFIEQPFITSTDASLVNFDYIDLAPGEEQQGAVYFQLFGDLPLTQITYGDGFARDVVVADLGPGAPPAPAVTIQATTPASPVASSPDCEGLVVWANDLIDRLGEAVVLTDSFEGVAPEDLDAVAIRAAADQLAVLAQEQRDSSPPPVAVELNTFMAEEFFQATSEATTGIADGLDAGNPLLIELAIAEAGAVSALFDTGGAADQFFNDIDTACPNEVQQLNS